MRTTKAGRIEMIVGTCGTCEDMFDLLETAIREMSPREKAQLRVDLRKAHGLEAQSEPDLYVN